jgi:energy-coupling factor transporter ATP-binding protein EcfA2
LFPHLTVGENVRYPLKLRRWARREADDRVEEMLALVRLNGLADRYPRELSGGQQQRVALARALAFRPALLLMDEPLGALDRTLRVEMEEEIRRIHREAKATVVYVTHDREEAFAMSDRIGVLRAGRLLQEGDARTLYEAPVDTFVARFFGDSLLLPVERVLAKRPDGARIRVLGQEIDVRCAGGVWGGTTISGFAPASSASSRGATTSSSRRRSSMSCTSATRPRSNARRRGSGRSWPGWIPVGRWRSSRASAFGSASPRRRPFLSTRALTVGVNPAPAAPSATGLARDHGVRPARDGAPPQTGDIRELHLPGGRL